MRRGSHLLLAALLAGACSNAPSSPEGGYARGKAALEKGDARTARIEFLNAIKARPNDPKLRLAQAEAYLALRDGAAAQAEVERARKLGASAAGTAHLMAQAFLLQGQHQQAVKESAAASADHSASP